MTTSNKPDWMLLVPACATILLIVFDQYQVFPANPIGRTPPALCAAVLLFIFIARALPRFKFQSRPEKWIAAFLVGSGVAYSATIEGNRTDATIAGYLDLLQPIILFLMLAYIAGQTKRGATMMLFSFIGCALLMMAFSDAYSSGFGSGGDRVGYEGQNLNRQAFIFGCSALSMAWIFLEVQAVKGFNQLIVGGLFAMMTAGMLLTGSRTGVAAFGVGFTTLVLLSGRNRFSARVVIGSAITCCVAVVMILNSEVLLSRISRTLAGQDYGKRDTLLVLAWQTSLESPIVGYGPFASGVLGKAAGKEIIDAHNAHFQVILKAGYPVYLIWLGFMLSTSFMAWKYRRYGVGRLSVAALLFVWTYSLAGSLVSSNFYWIVMALIIGGIRSFVLRDLFVEQPRPITYARRVRPTSWQRT